MVKAENVVIQAAYGVMISEGGIAPERPEAEKAWVLHWPDADLVIPWPHGMTLREAVQEWLGDIIDEAR